MSRLQPHFMRHGRSAGACPPRSVAILVAVSLLIGACIPVPRVKVQQRDDGQAPKPSPARFTIETLVRSGPALLFAVGLQEIDGLIRGDWPMVVDYRLDSGTATVVVEAASADRWRLELPATGPEGRELVIDDLPSELGKDLQAAKIWIEGSDGLYPEGFRLFGIGCGHEAVGSIAIDDVDFTTENIDTSAGEKARWTYRPLSDFDHGQVTIYRRKVVENDIESIAIPQLPVEQDPPRNHLVEGSWDGKDATGAASEGRHTLTVRLWRGTRGDKGGDWLVAEAANRGIEVR